MTDTSATPRKAIGFTLRDMRRYRARQRVAMAGLEQWRHYVDRAEKLEETRHTSAEVVALLSVQFGKAQS